jgi:hypothetical protein
MAVVARAWEMTTAKAGTSVQVPLSFLSGSRPSVAFGPTAVGLPLRTASCGWPPSQDQG